MELRARCDAAKLSVVGLGEVVGTRAVTCIRDRRVTFCGGGVAVVSLLVTV